MSEHMAEAAAVLASAIASDSPPDPAALIGQLTSANYRDYANTTQALIESLQRTIADREAELAAIRVRINQLFASDYMPTESAIQQAVFYPSKKLLDSLRERGESS